MPLKLPFVTDCFCREVVEKFPDLRPTITEKLTQTYSEIKSGKVFRGALWIVGEYCSEPAAIQSAFQALRSVLGEIPILASEQRLLDEAGGDEDVKDEKEAEIGEREKAPKSKPRVLADGTYATESAYTTASSSRLEAIKAAAKPALRSTDFHFPLTDPMSLTLYQYKQLSSSKATSTLGPSSQRRSPNSFCASQRPRLTCRPQTPFAPRRCSS